jgi:Phosphopantetheine attachment site
MLRSGNRLHLAAEMQKPERKMTLNDVENRNSVDSAGSWHAPLLQLWRKFLKLETVSIEDDFFEMGGDSMLAADLLTELQRLSESILFDAPTVRALAAKLVRLERGEVRDLRD